MCISGGHLSDVHHAKENVLLLAEEQRERKAWEKKGVIFSFDPPLRLYLILVVLNLKYNASVTFFKFFFLQLLICSLIHQS